MNKYKVTIPYSVNVTVEVEAEDEESAIDAAYDEVHITGYAGNGGADKLIGVHGANLSIEANDYPLVDIDGFDEIVEKL